MCVLCQENTLEVLWCSAEFKRNTQGAGCKTITDLLESFNAAGCLTRAINLSGFDDGEGIEATLSKHKAKWHMTLRDINLTKLN